MASALGREFCGSEGQELAEGRGPTPDARSLALYCLHAQIFH